MAGRPARRKLRIGRADRGPTNGISDVPGVAVGHATVPNENGAGTGVTAIVPHGGDLYREKATASILTVNGYGKLTGIAQVNELGTLETPILLTNTLSVGTVWDATVSWMLDRFDRPDDPLLSINPVVGECNDARLSDIRSRQVKASHVFQSLEAASCGPVIEGCVGAGAGMTAFGWKSGVGTASRRLQVDGRPFTLGVLALPNYGKPEDLVIAGVPIGATLRPPQRVQDVGAGSIVVVVATDLPIDHRQLLRLSKRAAWGVARTGGHCAGTSGEFVVAFTTAHRISAAAPRVHVPRVNDVGGALDEAFAAAAEATEEAIVSALLAADPAEGAAGRRIEAIPTDRVVALLAERGVAYS